MPDLDGAVRRAQASLNAQGMPEHGHGLKGVRILRAVLYPKERIIVEASQSPVETLAPGCIVATDQRVIIAKPSFWKLYIGFDLAGSSEFEIVHYNTIQGVAIARGSSLCSIKIHDSGGRIDKTKAGSVNHEMSGVYLEDGVRLVDFIEDVIGQKERKESKA